jgi:hypothetical protein
VNLDFTVEAHGTMPDERFNMRDDAVDLLT